MSRPGRLALFLLLAAPLAPACAHTTASPPASAGRTIGANAPLPRVAYRPAQEFRLANGMRVVIEEVRSRPVVALSFNVLGGSRDEAANEHGGAHFLEHMFYMGTPKHEPREPDVVARPPH